MEPESTISPVSFGKLIDVLGDPDAIKINYTSSTYGNLENNMQSALGQDASIAQQGFPITATLRGQGKPVMDAAQLKSLYNMTIDSEHPYLIIPLILGLDNAVQEYNRNQEFNISDYKALIGIKAIRWEEEGLLTIVNHHLVDIRHDGANEKLPSIEKVLRKEQIPHSVSTRYRAGEYEKFVTDWA